MNATPPVRPLYLTADGPHPIFAILHPAAPGVRRDLAVLLCPPFGWDEICSYRSRRDWAEQLAAAGYAALRIDLPGSGDSGGSPHDAGQLRDWADAVSSAARWLKSATETRATAAIGIGLGGLVICRALADGAPIDEMVLWGTPSRGRSFIRELRVFARLEDLRSSVSREPEAATASQPSRQRNEAGGFALGADMSSSLEELDLTALSTGRLRRALLLERDGISVDTRLHRHLAERGVDVAVASGQGYGAMMAKPHLARSPRDVFARVLDWLERGRSIESDAATGVQIAASRCSPDPPSAVELTVDEKRIRETPLKFKQPVGELFGVLAEPLDSPPAALCAVMLNAGAIRRIGPNRMWVEIARRWTARGVPTLRLDVAGIGDAEGDGERLTELAELYRLEVVEQVRGALDALDQRGVGRRFVLIGLCAGAFWSFHSAVADERVSAAFLLNPRALFWEPALEAARDFRRGLLRMSSWHRVVRGEVPLSRMLALACRVPFTLPRRALRGRHARRDGTDELDAALDRLRETGKQIRFVFSGNEPLDEELRRDGRFSTPTRWPNVRFDSIPGRDHSLRPLESQLAAYDVLDEALECELERIGPAVPEPAPPHAGSPRIVVNAFKSYE